MHCGYMGKILMVNLSTREIRDETIPDHVYEQYLSGMVLAVHILYDTIPAGADPLGPENVIGFVSGLLTGTGSLFAGRWMVVGKSPLTGGWGEANCGGSFSPAILMDALIWLMRKHALDVFFAPRNAPLKLLP